MILLEKGPLDGLELVEQLRQTRRVRRPVRLNLPATYVPLFHAWRP